MTSLALAPQTLTNRLSNLFGMVAQAPAIAKSVAQTLKQETATSFDAMFRANRLDSETLATQRAKLKDMAAHAGIMMLAKSLVAFTIGTGSIVPIAATVAVSTAAVSAYKIAQQALQDRKAGENTFWGSVKNAFTSGSALSTLKTQFKRAALGGAFGFAFHEVLSSIDWSALNPIGTAHAATLPAAAAGADHIGTLIATDNTLAEVQQHLTATGRMSRGARIDLAGALRGNAQDIKDMAWRLHNGIGVVKNDELAYKLYDRAAALGNVQAQRDLAYLARIGAYDPQGSEAVAALNRAELARIQAANGTPAPAPAPAPAPTLQADTSGLLNDDLVTSSPAPAPTDVAPTSGPVIPTTEPAPAPTVPAAPTGGPVIPTTENAAPTVPATSETAQAAPAPAPVPAQVFNDITTCSATPVSTETGGVLRRFFRFACSPLTAPTANPGDSVVISLNDRATRFVLPTSAQPVSVTAWLQNDVFPKFSLDNRDAAIAALGDQPRTAALAAGGPGLGGGR